MYSLNSLPWLTCPKTKHFFYIPYSLPFFPSFIPLFLSFHWYSPSFTEEPSLLYYKYLLILFTISLTGSFRGKSQTISRRVGAAFQLASARLILIPRELRPHHAFVFLVNFPNFFDINLFFYSWEFSENLYRLKTSTPSPFQLSESCVQCIYIYIYIYTSD